MFYKLNVLLGNLQDVFSIIVFRNSGMTPGF